MKTPNEYADLAEAALDRLREAASSANRTRFALVAATEAETYSNLAVASSSEEQRKDEIDRWVRR